VEAWTFLNDFPGKKVCNVGRITTTISMFEDGLVPTVRKYLQYLLRSSFILPAAILHELLHRIFRGEEVCEVERGGSQLAWVRPHAFYRLNPS
jgi:hypothetical protein